MTFRELANKHLSERGLFQKDIQAIIELAEKDPVFDGSMTNRWGDDLSGYPPEIKGTFLMGINSVALKYIDENIPKAWFRPLFVV